MIPYIVFTSFPIGPLDVHVWGLMVSAGLLTAVLVGRHIARQAGLDPDVLLDLAVWVMVGALIMGRLFYVFAYGMPTALHDPLRILKVWEGGMSSFGGYLGAGIGAWLFGRRRTIRLRRYAEISAYVLPLGYGIGRIGCFLIHDHPGILTAFPLAVRYPGGSRLDHGLLLSLVGFAIFVVFVLMRRRGWTVGSDRWRYLPVLLISYGSVRFVLDFLRAWDLPQSDARYLYLTPAQYGSVALVIGGAYLVRRARREAGPAKQ